jgi:multidrug efflux pump
MLPQDINKVFVRNSSGQMVSLASLATLHWIYGSPSLQHYNGFPSLELVGSAPPGKSTGQAMTAMEDLAQNCPPALVTNGPASPSRNACRPQAPLLYALSLIVVFLALAALYENWSIPVAVILVVPLGISARCWPPHVAVCPTTCYFKVGLLTIVGLSAKNAILIIEFAKDLQAQGKGLIEATLEAAHHAVAADFDDVARVHSGRVAAGVEHRRRFGQPA